VVQQNSHILLRILHLSFSFRETRQTIMDPDLNVTVASPKGPHVISIPSQKISRLAPFSALILSIVVVVIFLIRFYILESFLLRRIYGSVYTRMDDTTRRGFVNHHIAGASKILILILAAYPFIAVAFVNANLKTPFAGSKIVTMGDVLIVAAQMLVSIYIFELFYRPKISPVSTGHHIGTILIAQAAIAISLPAIREKDATYEFVLCTVWGAFDIVAEFLPHVSIILYRVYPDRHNFLRKLFRAACGTTLTGTTAETIVTMWLFGSLWSRWTIAFKVTTPMLHCLFAAAQLWGSWNFYKMYKKQCRIIANGRGGLNNLEAGEREMQGQPKEMQDLGESQKDLVAKEDSSAL